MQVINQLTLPVWCAFLRHPEISGLDAIRNLLPKFFKICTEKVFRVGVAPGPDAFKPQCSNGKVWAKSNLELRFCVNEFTLVSSPSDKTSDIIALSVICFGN